MHNSILKNKSHKTCFGQAFNESRSEASSNVEVRQLSHKTNFVRYFFILAHVCLLNEKKSVNKKIWYKSKSCYMLVRFCAIKFQF